MGKSRVVAETGAGQHGVATAAAAAQARDSVPRLHGRDRHGAPVAERGAHAPPRGRGRRRRLGLEDPEGRHQRGHARLDRERRDDPLRPRLRARAASLSFDRPRVPVGDRPRGARAVPPARGTRPARRRRVRGRRLQRDRPVLGVPRLARRALWHRGRRTRPRAGRSRRALFRRSRRRAAWNAHDAAPGRGRSDAADALGLGRPRLSGGRDPSTRRSTTRGAWSTQGSRTTRPWRRSRCCPRRKGFFRRSSPLTRSPSPRSSRGAFRARPGSS